MLSFRTILYLTFALTVTACSGQQSHENDQIILTSEFKRGVVSEDGTVVIDSVYQDIRRLTSLSRLTLPPTQIQTAQPIDLYLVTDSLGHKALFRLNGELAFPFMECQNLQVDPASGLVVVNKALPQNRYRSEVYTMDGKRLFEESFEQVAFLENSPLVALIAEDGANDEYYLYHPKTQEKLGPYDAMNFYTENAPAPLGMSEERFAPFQKLNVITVRQTVNNDYQWGMVNLKGEVILPVSYRRVSMTDDRFRTFIERADRPEKIDFLFFAQPLTQTEPTLLFDEQLNKYEWVKQGNEPGVIRLLDDTE